MVGEGALVNFVINRLPPLRELVLEVVCSEIRDGQLRRLERLRAYRVGDWDRLIGETTASLKYLHIEVGHHSFFGGLIYTLSMRSTILHGSI